MELPHWASIRNDKGRPLRSGPVFGQMYVSGGSAVVVDPHLGRRPQRCGEFLFGHVQDQFFVRIH